MSRESLSDFNDMIRYTILKAPDRFPADTGMSLSKAFARLREQLTESKAEVGTFYSEISSHLEAALLAFEEGDIKQGIKSLQNIDNLIRSNFR